MDNMQSNKHLKNTTPENGGQIESVIGATKELLEHLEETKHEVISLRNIIKQDEQALNQLLNDVKNVKYFSIQNIAHLESNATMKKTIEEYNSKFLSFAQMIYLNGQELYNDLDTIKNEDKKIIDKLDMKEAEYDSMVKNYRKQEEELAISLDALNKQHLADEQCLNDNENENQELKEEIEELNKKIQFYEDELLKFDEKILSEEESSHEKNIALLNNDITFLDNEIALLNQSLGTIKREKLNAEEEMKKNITEIDNICIELEERLNSENCKLTEMKNKNSELRSKISNLESAILLKSDEIEKYKNNLRELESQLSDMEQNHQRELSACKDAILEKEEVLKNEKQLNQDLSDAMNDANDKIKIIEGEIIDLQTCEKNYENIPDDHLDQQQEAKRIELEQIKSSKRALKEQLRILESEQTRQIETVKIEIDLLEKNNKKLEDEINNTEEEMTGVKSEIERIELQNMELESNIMKLDSGIQMLVEELESEKSPAKPNFVQPAERALLVTTKKQVKTLRHWDSDSSWEGENKTFSARARKKMKKYTYYNIK